MAIEREPVSRHQGSQRAETAAGVGSVAATYRRLVLVAGLRPREAASLVGRLEGLPMVAGGWTLAEVERLLFVRALVAAGRLGS